MSIEANKAIVQQFLAKFGSGDADGLIDSLTDDATWWIGGKPTDLPQAGPKTKDGISAVLRGIGTKIPGGIDMRIRDAPVEVSPQGSQARWATRPRAWPAFSWRRALRA